MAEKTSGSEKKTGTAKSNTKKRVSKGESVVCEVCGLSVVVEEVGDVDVVEETTLLCCGKPMKAKTSKPKAAKK